MPAIRKMTMILIFSEIKGVFVRSRAKAQIVKTANPQTMREGALTLRFFFGEGRPQGEKKTFFVKNGVDSHGTMYYITACLE